MAEPRQVFLAFGFVASATLALVVGLSVAATPACSASDDTGNDGGPDAEGVVVPDPCTSFTEAGAPCSPVSNNVCFALCATGGCVCTASAGVGSPGVWVCTTDVSCMPDSGPLDANADVVIVGPPDDAGDDDTDATSDAGADGD